jgi:hypothetical protein
MANRVGHRFAGDADQCVLLLGAGCDGVIYVNLQTDSVPLGQLPRRPMQDRPQSFIPTMTEGMNRGTSLIQRPIAARENAVPRL